MWHVNHAPLRTTRTLRFHIIFVSVNAITSGLRSRTRDAIGAVRHVFLDADGDGPGVLSRIQARLDLPNPSYVLHSSPDHRRGMRCAQEGGTPCIR